MNNRRDFIKIAGMASAATLLPTSRMISEETQGASCVLIPSETAGPFPLDLTENNFYFRKDIREGKLGAPLLLKLKVLGDSNCLPLQNVRVNIWHCDKDGLYSGYSGQGNAGQAGLTYLRGYQITDADGEVEFLTIVPGWYNGRVCHIHFQVYVSSAYAAISQLTFDVEQKQAVFAANPTLYTKGADPLAIASDNIFADGYLYQLAQLTPNSEIGGYNSYLEVTVKGSGATTVGYLEGQNAEQFVLGQNYPNPYVGQTTIPVELFQPSDVSLDIFDVQGHKVARIDNPGLPTGIHHVPINIQGLNLSSANYVYQIEVRNLSGVFRECKLMSARK